MDVGLQVESDPPNGLVSNCDREMGFRGRLDRLADSTFGIGCGIRVGKSVSQVAPDAQVVRVSDKGAGIGGSETSDRRLGEPQLQFGHLHFRSLFYESSGSTRTATRVISCAVSIAR